MVLFGLFLYGIFICAFFGEFDFGEVIFWFKRDYVDVVICVYVIRGIILIDDVRIGIVVNLYNFYFVFELFCVNIILLNIKV